MSHKYWFLVTQNSTSLPVGFRCCSCSEELKVLSGDPDQFQGSLGARRPWCRALPHRLDQERRGQLSICKISVDSTWVIKQNSSIVGISELVNVNLMFSRCTVLYSMCLIPHSSSGYPEQWGHHFRSGEPGAGHPLWRYCHCHLPWWVWERRSFWQATHM